MKELMNISEESLLSLDPVVEAELLTVEEIKAHLETTDKGNVCQSMQNCKYVLEHDPILRMAIRRNDMTCHVDITRPVPWKRRGIHLTDTDMNNVALYPTKKIGKNNPKAEEIKLDNYFRQEWNLIVDRAFVEGADKDTLMAMKHQHITGPVQKSIREQSWKPGLFTDILRIAIGVLRVFLEYLKEVKKSLYFDSQGEQLLDHYIKVDATPAALPPNDKGPRPSSLAEEAEVMRLQQIHEKLEKCEKKIYAIEQDTIRKRKKKLESEFAGKFINHKEIKKLEYEITANDHKLENAKFRLEIIPSQHGYRNVMEVEEALKSANTALAKIKKVQAEWDKPKPEPVRYMVSIKAEAQPKLTEKQMPPKQPVQEKESLHKRLEEKKREVAARDVKKKTRAHDKDCL